MSATTARKSKTKTATPVSLVLRSVTLEEAIENLRCLDADFGLIPSDAAPHLDEAIATIRTHFAGTSVYELIEGHSAVLTVITGVAGAQQNRYLGSELAEPLHLHRNVALALAMAATLGIQGADVDAVSAAFKPLKQRTTQPHRAYTDDEVLLLRLYAVYLSRLDLKSQRTGAIYAQVDAGLTPGESQGTTSADVDTSPGAALIAASGNGHLEPRVLPMDTFGETMLAAFIARTKPATDELLTYRPRKQDRSFPNASASAHQAVDRVRQAVGLTATDTKASSVTMWRLETIYRVGGELAAVEASGRSCVENLREVLWHGTRRQATPQAKRRRRTTMLPQAA